MVVGTHIITAAWCSVVAVYYCACMDWKTRGGLTQGVFLSAVISYVEESDADIAGEIQKVVNRSTSFDKVFSRNKLLRRKLNRRKKL